MRRKKLVVLRDKSRFENLEFLTIKDMREIPFFQRGCRRPGYLISIIYKIKRKFLFGLTPNKKSKWTFLKQSYFDSSIFHQGLLKAQSAIAFAFGFKFAPEEVFRTTQNVQRITSLSLVEL
ncbi:hypothetical protein ABIB40_003536 [Pedobacter sp. UYP30]